MPPHHDIAALILLATALASKRRPADLTEIVAAADLLQGFVPYADKLDDALRRLSANGLIEMAGDGFVPTPPALALVAELPRKAAAEEQVALLQDRLDSYRSKEERAPVQATAEQLEAAIRAHKATRKAPGKNLLMPKPKPDRHFKVEGRWRRAPARGGKS